MSAEVISLDQARIDNGSWISDRSRCMHCGHEAISCSPVGTVHGMECSQCHLMQVTYVRLCEPDSGVETWVCKCGSELFYLTRDGALCVKCGLTHTDYFA